MPLPEIPRDRSADFPQSLLREVSRRGAEFAGLLRDLAPAAALAALVVGGLALGLGHPGENRADAGAVLRPRAGRALGLRSLSQS